MFGSNLLGSIKLIFLFLLLFIVVPKTKIMGNILNQKTKKNFGYYPKDLKPSSEKLVIWSCKKCNLEQEKKYRYAVKNDLCLNCSNKKNANTNIKKRAESVRLWHTKNEHPLKGTHRPEHVLKELDKGRKKIHELNKLPERKKILSKKMSGENNPFFNKKHTEESLKKMREFQKTNMSSKGINSNFYGKKPFHGKGEWYLCKDGSKIWMRSSWEIKFAKYLDQNNIKWLYEPKSFPITYNNKEGTYSPDFFLLKKNYFIEIKGWWRDDAFIKYNSFIKQYPNLKIELYNKEKLKELKIL